MISNIGNILKTCDKACDKLPVISTISNIVDLFQKCVLSCLVLPIAGKKSIAGNSYYTHLNDKNFGRCVLLLIPVLGNLVVGIYDFVKTEDKKTLPEDTKTLPKDFIRAYKQSLLKDIESDARIVSKMKEEFKNDRNFLLSAIEKNPKVFEYIKEEFKNDRSFLLSAIEKKPKVLEYIKKEFKNDRNFLLSAIEKNPKILEYIKKQFKNDKNFLLSAIEKNPKVLEYIKEEFKNDKDFQKEAKKRIIMKAPVDVDAEHSIQYLSLDFPKSKMKKAEIFDSSFAALDMQQGKSILRKMVSPLSVFEQQQPLDNNKEDLEQPHHQLGCSFSPAKKRRRFSSISSLSTLLLKETSQINHRNDAHKNQPSQASTVEKEPEQQDKLLSTLLEKNTSTLSDALSSTLKETIAFEAIKKEAEDKLNNLIVTAIEKNMCALSEALSCTLKEAVTNEKQAIEV